MKTTKKTKYIVFGSILTLVIIALWACPTETKTEYVETTKSVWKDIGADPAQDRDDSLTFTGGVPDQTLPNKTEADFAFEYRQRYGGWEFTEQKGGAKVYFTKNISGDSLKKLYAALGSPIPAGAKVAVKLNMGENKTMDFGPNGPEILDPPQVHPNILKPSVIKPLFDQLKANGSATLVDSTTYYDYEMGAVSRATAAGYIASAQINGFTEADFGTIDILNGNVTLDGKQFNVTESDDWLVDIPNYKHLPKARLGNHIQNYDWILSLAHFKGHNNAGVGGTFKNLAIGIASYYGKRDIHRKNIATDTFFTSGFEPFMEKIVEYNNALIKNTKFKDHIVYVNVMSDLALGCDCVPVFMAPVEMADIGILASLDPVALEKATVDLIYKAPDGAHLVQRMEAARGLHQIRHAARLGLGNPFYELIDIDK